MTGLMDHILAMEIKPRNGLRKAAIDMLSGRGTLDRQGFAFLILLLACGKFSVDRIFDDLADCPWSWGDVIGTRFLNTYLWQSLYWTAGDQWLTASSVVSLLTFVYICIVLVLARLRSAGIKVWWVFLFFVPAVKLLFFVTLCFVGSSAIGGFGNEAGRTWIQRWTPRSRFGAALAGIAILALVGTPMVWLATSIFGDYGWCLFLGAPFALGFCSVIIYNVHGQQNWKSSCGVALATVGLLAVILLVAAIEGVICIFMAAPVAAVMALIGGRIAHNVSERLRSKGGTQPIICAVLVVVPCSMSLEHAAVLTAPLLSVKTEQVVNAPPGVVWKHIVSFGDLPPPTEWMFRAGVAYPLRTTIQGSGVGATRNCELSTGPVVETVETWDEPHVLRFKVTKNPEAMHELSPYGRIRPPHLTGYMQSRVGQFVLVELSEGRTRIEGTSWYEHHLWPVGYWRLWSDEVIHAVHRRVLHQVKLLAEEETRNAVRPD